MRSPYLLRPLGTDNRLSQQQRPLLGTPSAAGGRLSPPSPPPRELPLERRLALARELVIGKIANGRVVLQMLTSRAPCSNHLRGLEERRRKSISAALAGQGDLKRTARP